MKFSCVYIEREVLDTPRVQQILGRLGDTPRVEIDRFGEVFNRRAQNFRLQKSNPALILARKHGKLVLPAPPGYGFSNDASYYFSHMYNCVYDCRYCFLQGMYRSAHHVLFTNYEDFADQIEATSRESRQPVFYSGYDCDSLALEPVSRFIAFFTEWLAGRPGLTIEVRTKSTQVRDLLKREPLQNCVIAMSFMPQGGHERWERRVPSIQKRIEVLRRLQQQGWPVALRFEPVIYSPEFRREYDDLFTAVFGRLNAAAIHSVSLGLFRMPKHYLAEITRLYPDEPLFARSFMEQDGELGQLPAQQQELRETLEQLLFRHISTWQYYRCG